MLLLLFTFIIGHSFGAQLSSFEVPYNKAVSAYTDERWSECIAQFEDALQLYKLYKSVVINCRLECKSLQFDPLVKDNIEDLKMYEKMFRIKNCLTDCHDKLFSKLHLKSDPEESIINKMVLKKPYEYLHVCYFQMNALPRAASAAYTYLEAHPDSEVMKKNLEYYIDQPEVDRNEVVDLESEDYKVLYNLGVKTYRQTKWGETISAMEEAILDYLSWEDRCRVECETQPEQEVSPELMITLSNRMGTLIYCKQQCQDKLKMLNYVSGTEFLADVLNYLQISYFHLGRLDDAAKSVASYLALNPNDEEMVENKLIYDTLVKDDAFTERSDIIYYLKRDTYEKQILNIFRQGDNYIPNI